MAFGEFFLARPAAELADGGAPACGPRALTLDFAGGPYAFSGLSPGQEEVVRERFGELLAPGAKNAGGGEPAAVMTAFLQQPAGAFRDFDVIGWTCTVDQEETAEEVLLAGRKFLARLAWGPGLGGTVWTSILEMDGFQDVFENFFRVLVAYRLLELGGVLLHSAAVVEDGGALLFYGHSTAGKTTMARRALAAGRAVLSDDINALCPAPGGPVVEQLPFAGDLGQCAVRGGRHPLRGCYRLRKGDTVAVEPLGPAQAFASLLACAPYVNADPYHLDALEANLEALVRGVPTGTLTSARESPFEEIAACLQRSSSTS